jgi:hypothetical protein
MSHVFPENEEHGKYIIEVMTGNYVPGSRTEKMSTLGFWLKVGKHPGSIDEQLFICLHCKGLMHIDEAIQNIMCPRCGAPKEVADLQYVRGDNALLASVINQHFHGLKGNADIKLIRSRSGDTLHAASDMTINAQEREKRLHMIRSQTEAAFYTKGRIEKDLRSGADPIKTIEAFLNA